MPSLQQFLMEQRLLSLAAGSLAPKQQQLLRLVG